MGWFAYLVFSDRYLYKDLHYVKMKELIKWVWHFLPHRLRKKLLLIVLIIILMLFAVYMLGYYNGINHGLNIGNQAINNILERCYCFDI